MSECQNCAILKTALATLEREKAEVEAERVEFYESYQRVGSEAADLYDRLAQAEATVINLRQELEHLRQKYWADLDQAEATVAKMRVAIEAHFEAEKLLRPRLQADEMLQAALSPDAGRAPTEECEVCHGKAFWLSKEGAEIPCEMCGHLKKGTVYFITVEPDGTWLILNGERRRAAIRLEDAAHGPIVKAAIAEVRAALKEQP